MESALSATPDCGTSPGGPDTVASQERRAHKGSPTASRHERAMIPEVTWQ